MSVTSASEIGSLLEVSARIGGEPLLVQAATGNTSIKLDGVLWIKASGKWLMHATQEEILIPVNLAETLSLINQDVDPAGQSVVSGGKPLRASIETAMHSVLPHRVVLHVHSVNTIAWAVRRDGRAELESRLKGIEWQWIPDVPSGLPLARAVAAAIARAPAAKVLVLSNHGLVVCGADCESAEELLREVEWRVAIVPRCAPEAKLGVLNRFSERSSWQVPGGMELHALGTDGVSRRIVCDGVLYPCQAIFLTPQARSFRPAEAGEDLPDENLGGIDEPFVLIEDAGVLVRQELNPVESATLAALVQVLQRIPESAPLQYLRKERVRDLLCDDVYHYREVVKENGTGRPPLRECEGLWGRERKVAGCAGN
jgi:rhamnose utilization protein RhaD (predicted bifunctional aldolase and dehydrogenase)